MSMKLAFYNADLSPWMDHVEAVDYLKIERQAAMDEIQVVAAGQGLIYRLVAALCCHVIEDNNSISMWVLDRSSIKEQYDSGLAEVTFTLYEPLWLLNMRVAEKREYTDAGLLEFTQNIIEDCTEGDRSLGEIDLTALSTLPDTYQVTRDVDGEGLADLLSEIYSDRELKFFFEMTVAGSMRLVAGVQEVSHSEDAVVSPLLQNMQANVASATTEFGAVYVGGEYKIPPDTAPDDEQEGGRGEPGEEEEEAPTTIDMRGYFSFGGTGLFREEHYTKSTKSSEGMDEQEFQDFLDAEAERIAKKRKVETDISCIPSLINAISGLRRYNRAGIVIPADIGGKLTQYMIDEVKTTPVGTTFSVSQYGKG